MANVSLLVPAGVTTVHGQAASYTPDASGLISVSETSGDIVPLLQAGCMFHSFLHINTTSTGTSTGTSEQDLMTYAMPAHTLNQNAKGLRIRAYGVTGATANNKTMKLYFGSVSIATPAAATNAKGWALEMEVYRTGVSAQVVVATGIVDVTPVTPSVTTATATETSAITIKVTGTDGTSAANDIVAKALIVEMMY